MILHICFPSKFMSQFISFMCRHFNEDEHEFLFTSTKKALRQTDPDTYEVIARDDFPFHFWFYGDENCFLTRNGKMLSSLYGCQKMIFHGLFLPRRMAQMIGYSPFLLKKGYWIMWGGDFYFQEGKGITHRRIIRKMGHLLTFVFGDVRYVVENYRATGKYTECLAYPSNVIQPGRKKPKKDHRIRIQVGNSATATNQHAEVFRWLSKYKNRDIEVICPLSYGDTNYADKIIALGKEIFADKFIPLTCFLPQEEFYTLLSSIDIAIFNNNRQQAMGNIITHLGYGNKVYLRSDQHAWHMFKQKGIRVYDVLKGIDIDTFAFDRNPELMAKYFSRDRMIDQWQTIFSEK